MFCERCQIPVASIKDKIKEETNGAIAYTEVVRGFCFGCGAVFRPVNANFLLTIHNLSRRDANTFSVLESGDTFSEMWTLLPLYRDLMKAGGDVYSLRILSRKSEALEAAKEKVKYDILYQEQLEKILVEKE